MPSPKNVTPPPFEIDPELLEAAAPIAPTTHLQAIVDRGLDEINPEDLGALAVRLTPMANLLRASVAEIALIPVDRATIEQRTQLADLRALLDAARADLSTWVTAIDIGFRRAAMTTGASEFRLEDGLVRVEVPRGEWVVNVQALQSALRAFVESGELSEEEFNDIFTTTVTPKANGTKLNYFSTKRGEALAATINLYRVWHEGDPNAAKVRFTRKEGK